MARPLVWLFLGSIVFAGVTVVLGVLHAARDAWILARFTLPAADLPPPPALPQLLAWAGPWLAFALWYFDIIVPVGVLMLLVSDLLRGKHPARWRVPSPLPWPMANVTVVLTAYNDEASIGPAIEEFRRLQEIGQIIVVDNNCVDRTAEVARSRGATVIPETKQGYGFACRAGLRYALDRTDSPIIALAEGDMTFFAEDIRKMLPYIGHGDMVVGTRTSRALTRRGSQMDWFTSWGNLFLAFLIRLRYWDWTFLGRVQLTDVGCTFRVIRRESLARIIDRLTVGGMYFSPHMILMALRDWDTVIEVPVQFRARVGQSKGAGSSRLRAIRIGLEMLWEIALH
ncbi:MAG: glycosyltransferase family 2 protein [Thermoplasmata archaeon]|nr:glycosyltransferase family 2 protein [Thermoplasmata archaeon]